MMRDLYKGLATFEESFHKKHGLNINEAMAICSLCDKILSASEIAAFIGMSSSHCSKTIGSIEKKGLICRKMGENDKRQMHFSLSEMGKDKLDKLKSVEMEIPELFLPLFANQ